MASGLETLDLALMHKHALTTLVLPRYSSGTQNWMIKRAETFFVEVIKPIEHAHRVAMEINAQLNRLNETLRQRTVDLTATNRQLQQEIVRRQALEEALKKSEQHYGQLLERSRLMQEQLRHLSHQLLPAQETGS